MKLKTKTENWQLRDLCCKGNENALNLPHEREKDHHLPVDAAMVYQYP